MFENKFQLLLYIQIKVTYIYVCMSCLRVFNSSDTLVLYWTHGHETFCKHLDDKMFNLLFDHKVFSVKQKKVFWVQMSHKSMFKKDFPWMRVLQEK